MLQYSLEYLREEKNVSDIVQKVKEILAKKQELYNRYTRKNSDKETQVPLEYYIVNIASGFFGGKAPVYSVKQEKDETKKEIIKRLFDKEIGTNANKDEFQMVIDYIKDYNDNSSFFYECVKDYMITGSCYGIEYETTENEIVYANLPATQCVAIYDYSTPVQKLALVRVWKEKQADGFEADMVQIITAEDKRTYVNGKKTPNIWKEIPEERENVNWLLVPIFAVENPDGLGIFEPVLTLIDAYEQIIQNNRNTFQYNDDAKLQITGFTPQNELMIQDEKGNWVQNPARVKEDEFILNAKTFYTPDGTGNIAWIIKDINDTASENHKKTLMELILMTVCIPNVTDVGFTNADNASALEKKFFPLEQVLIQADKQFKKELLCMWENIIDRINIKKSTNFDFREIQITLERNMPTEKKEVVEMALQLRDLLSDETVIGMLPFDIDVQSELAKKDEQDKSNMEMFNIKGVNDEEVSETRPNGEQATETVSEEKQEDTRQDTGNI